MRGLDDVGVVVDPEIGLGFARRGRPQTGLVADLDPDGVGPMEPPTTPDEQCSDGEDNDGDGLVDCDDWDCTYNPFVTVCDDGPRVCEVP